MRNGSGPVRAHQRGGSTACPRVLSCPMLADAVLVEIAILCWHVLLSVAGRRSPMEDVQVVTDESCRAVNVSCKP
eukprot:4972698-Prymnesium_polylepis.1